MRQSAELIVLIKGGGEVASGIAHRLHRSHLRVCLTEIAAPLAVSRGTTFSEAVFDGTKTIEGVTAELTATLPEDIYRVWERRNMPVIVDPGLSIKDRIKPDVLIDATMPKRSTGIKINDAPLVIGVGPGFYAGRDVHMVIESNHSDDLGRVIQAGEAEKDTGTPVAIGGLTKERVIWAPRDGIFTSDREIGGLVTAHQTIGWVDKLPLEAPMNGVLRGLIRSGVSVSQGDKLIEVDPVNDRSICWLITNKMKIIGGGVLEAIKLKFSN